MVRGGAIRGSSTSEEQTPGSLSSEPGSGLQQMGQDLGRGSEMALGRVPWKLGLIQALYGAVIHSGSLCIPIRQQLLVRGLAGADAGGVSHPSGTSSWSLTLGMVSLFNCGHLIGVLWCL